MFLLLKRDRTSLENDPHKGKPKTENTHKNIKKIHDMILDNLCLKFHEIARVLGILKQGVR